MPVRRGEGPVTGFSTVSREYLLPSYSHLVGWREGCSWATAPLSPKIPGQNNQTEDGSLSVVRLEYERQEFPTFPSLKVPLEQPAGKFCMAAAVSVGHSDWENM